MMEVSSLTNTAYVYTDDIENLAVEQIRNILETPAFSQEKIRIMPDVHAGKGCVIGFTSTYSDSIIPNLVGVDIGCGMLAVNVGSEDVDLKALDEAGNKIPNGFAHRGVPVESAFNYGGFACLEGIGEKAVENARLSLGTLGGGNHFIEMNVAENGDHWLVVHSGSRGLGVSVANWWQGIAQQMHPDAKKELASLEGDALKGYLNDVDLAAKWAVENRAAIMAELLSLTGLKEVSRFETVHNYVDVVHGIVRKGSVAAYKDQLLLIPLNMRDGSLICRGRGSEAWNCSAPHGAGRKMSRGEAKRTLSLDAFKEAMKGVYTTSVCESTIDEAPFAYKDSGSIVNLIDGETVDVIERIVPVWNLKAH